MSRPTAYRLLKRVRTEGEAALLDGRHGHPAKLRVPLRHWLEEYWCERPQVTWREAQTALEARFGVRVSQSHLSRVRTVRPRDVAPAGAILSRTLTGERGVARYPRGVASLP